MTVASVRVTAHFEASLARIESFCIERDAPDVFTHLVQDLRTNVVTVLEEHPRIGRCFLARSPKSAEARSRINALAQRLGSIDVREYLAGDYLILYALHESTQRGTAVLVVDLLSIRHHRELSFDFPNYWQENRDG